MVSYDVFISAFLDKITEYDFIHMDQDVTESILDGYMKRACYQFSRVCPYKLTDGDDAARQFDVDIPADRIDEVADIVSEGMVEQWLKPYVYKSENLTNILNTSDYESYSPAELLLRVVGVYRQAKSDFRYASNRYSYEIGDISDLHL